MAGRKPKPTALKKLQGNPGKRELNAREPQAPRGVPACPEFLTERGRRGWASLAPTLDEMGVLTMADATALSLLCDAWAEYLDAREVVNGEGMTYATRTEGKDGADGSVMYRKRPEVEIAQDAWRRVMKALAEFGLTPSSRSRIKLPGLPDPVDPFDEFENGASK